MKVTCLPLLLTVGFGNPPLKVPPETTPKLDWRKLLSTYEEKKGHSFEAVNTKNPTTRVPNCAPEEKDSSSLFKIYNSLNTLCLALTFYISLGISAIASGATL